MLKEINESSPEELEKRLKKALKVVGEIQQLDGLVQWSFPAGTTIASLVTTASMIAKNEATRESNSIDISIDANTNELSIIAENQNNTPLEVYSSITVEEDATRTNISILTVQDEIILT
ncbi:hypothetical protein Scep_011406 [Stephania cephalantha]|uniref:Uncharacterized protein n=1 Tax=Stephania cephalantha TaxID=152367 RepID=A0AAP0JDA4_9MAGN